jgi:hypothetical protein
MLQMRLEGDPAESDALLAVLAAAGVEVQVGTRKQRREGFTHTYAVVRLADQPAPAGPIRAHATVAAPPTLPGGADRRPVRRPGR